MIIIKGRINNDTPFFFLLKCLFGLLLAAGTGAKIATPAILK